MTASCAPCAFAAEHGWWGPDHRGTHCRVPTCHRSWASTREAHCVVCHAHFTGDTAAEAHWLHGRHHDVETVAGLYLGPDGVWSTSADRDPDALRERLAHARRGAA